MDRQAVEDGKGVMAVVARLSKIVMCVALGLFAGLVAVDNIVDYGTNYAFVQHVLSMDTIHPGDALKSRAITSPLLWRCAYALIIFCQALTALLFLVGAGHLWIRRDASAATFQQAKGWVQAAGAAGFLVWFFGFMVVGGEWFQMWQSAQWNGQQPAFRFIVIIVAVLIFVSQPDETSREP